MGRPRNFDLEEAIDAATKLFWHKGYDKTSLNDLTDALGIVPASFYFAFGSKEELFRQVIERYIAFQADAFDQAFQAPSTHAAVKALLRGYADVVTDPAHAPGCLLINNVPSTEGDMLRQWLAKHRESLRTRLEKRFRADLAGGKLPLSFDPQAMAGFVMTLAGGLAVEAQSGIGQRDLYAMIDFALKNFAGRESGRRLNRSAV